MLFTVSVSHRPEFQKHPLSNLVTLRANTHPAPLQELDAALLSGREEGIQAKIGQIERFIRERSADLRQLSAKNPIAAKAEMSKHRDSIWVTPENEGYTLSGKWNLIGGRSDGAGGPDRTMAPMTSV